MSFGQILISSAALGVVVFLTTVAQATSFGVAGSRPETNGLAIVVKGEHKRGHGCGPFMYRKGGKCIDARDKK